MMKYGMYGGGREFFDFLTLATWAVWLIVGLLLIAYLWKKLNNR